MQRSSEFDMTNAWINVETTVKHFKALNATLYSFVRFMSRLDVPSNAAEVTLLCYRNGPSITFICNIHGARP
jgi:hypothetical protein